MDMKIGCNGVMDMVHVPERTSTHERKIKDLEKNKESEKHEKSEINKESEKTQGVRRKNKRLAKNGLRIKQVLGKNKYPEKNKDSKKKLLT